MADNTHHCPICDKAFKADDVCATDITEGVCHAACLEGSPVVDPETGEPIDGPASTYPYSEVCLEAEGDGQGALVERARYFVENPSAWESGFDQAASDRLAEILAVYEALTRENAALRAGKERLERERDKARRDAECLLVSFVREHCDPVEGWAPLPDLEGIIGQVQGEAGELSAICAVVGCQEKPGVALRFVKELRRDLQRAHERHIELLRTWEDASLTERQELDRLRRGWGPLTPTERMARRTDLQAAMRTLESAMDAVLPDDKKDEDLTRNHFQAAYDKLSDGHREIIALLHALPELSAPDLLATPPSPEPDAELVEALEPFTSIAIVGSLPDNIRADFSLPVTVGDLRRLRIAALRCHRKQGGA